MSFRSFATTISSVSVLILFTTKNLDTSILVSLFGFFVLHDDSDDCPFDLRLLVLVVSTQCVFVAWRARFSKFIPPSLCSTSSTSLPLHIPASNNIPTMFP